jgi:hypothetical protein
VRKGFFQFLRWNIKGYVMSLRPILIIAAFVIPFATVTIGRAQFQPPPQARPDQVPPCVQEFIKLREVTEKRGLAIKQAGEQKVSPKEACGLFNAFTAAEEKMLKYAVDNGVWCGIPQQVIDSIKQGHTKATEMRTRICRAAAVPVRAAAPSLSDALSSPIPDPNNIKGGSGTFDTLTGPPLGK